MDGTNQHRRGDHQRPYPGDRGHADRSGLSSARPAPLGGGEAYNDFPSGGRQSHESSGADSRLGRGARGVPPRGYKRSDARILEDVCESLINTGLNCGGLEVTVQNGIVHLTGEVGERSDKHRVEQIAADVAGVADVANELRVRGRSSGDASRPQPAADSPTRGIAGAVMEGARLQEGADVSDP